MNDMAMSKISEDDLSQKTAWRNSSTKTPSEMWREFVDNTTLHGIRYVFKKRHILIRLIWLVLLLASGGYYIFTVYRAFIKYYERPINTVVSKNDLKEMDFPAVTICSLNAFAKSKIFMTDDNPLFASSGLNISSCAVTAGVRGNRPCGSSVLCCCAPSEFSGAITAVIPNCTRQYKQDLLDTMQRSLHRLDVEAFFKHYSQDISSLAGPICTFGWEESPCSIKDFVPNAFQWGMCYTFNSGADGTIKKVDTGGVASGLSFIIDAQTSEYTLGKYSEGFKVLIHGQGEYVDEWEGINVGPGQHVSIALSQKRVKCFRFLKINVSVMSRLVNSNNGIQS